MDEDRRPDLDPLEQKPEDDGFDFLTAPFDPERAEPAEPVRSIEPVAEDADDDVGEPARPALVSVPPPVARLVPVPDEPERDEEPEVEPVGEEEEEVEPEPPLEPVALVRKPEPAVELTPAAELEAELEPVLSFATPEPAPTVAAEPDPELEPETDETPVAALEHVAEPEPLSSDADVAVEADVPFWKKEISLGRKKEAAPAKEPRERRPRRERPEAVSAAPDEQAKPTPFWKKELSVGRKPKPEAVAADPVADEPKSVPFWKKELSVGRKKSAPVEAAAVEAPEEPVEDEQPKESVPFWRKEISLGGGKRGERPKPPKRDRPSRRRAETPEPAAEAEVPADDEAPTEERVPFYSLKREPRAPRAPRERRSLPKARRAKAASDTPQEEKPKRPARTSRRAVPAVPRAERAAQPKEKKAKAAKSAGAAKRHKKLVGLKIGASQLAAAHIVNNGDAELVKVAREPLEDGVVAGGELRDPEALTLALKDFFNKHKLPKRGVRLGIANNRIGVRTFEITGIDDEKQLANAVRFRAQEALPIPIEEAVLDWRILGESVDEEGQRSRRILLVVAYRELIDRYVDACSKAGVKLVGIDLEAFALLRALGGGERRGGDEGALVAVSVGHERSTFAVSDGEVCEFTRVLEWGGHALNVAIARVLEKTPSEVEDVKLGLSLDNTPEELPAGLSTEDADKARDAVRRQLQTFARELVSSLQFYQNQPGSLGIGEVVLTGGTTQLPGFALELERMIGVRVRVGDPLARVNVPKNLNEDGLASLSVAIGLGIED